MFWLAIIVLLLCISYLWYRREYERKIKPLEKIPMLYSLPIFGHALALKSTTEILPILVQTVKECGSISKFLIGPLKAMVFFADISSLEYLLNSTKLIRKSSEYKFFNNWLGTGLLTSDGEKWKKHRKIITPTFHFKILEDFIDVFNDQSDILVKKLAKEVGNESFDVYQYVSLCTLDIICETAMGTPVNAQEYTDSVYVKSVREMARIIIERTYTLKMFDPIYRFSKDYKLEKKYLEIIHGYTNGMIQKKRQQLANNNQVLSKTDEIGRKKRLAFLDLLLLESHNSAENYLTDTDLREEVDTFLFEGHDTTAAAISFILYCLSTNFQVQEKCVEELALIFGDDKTRQPTYQDLQEMKYLELVIKETLRLYPSVPFYARELIEDEEIGGYFIPKGTTVTILAYMMHRDPKFFPEPEKFIPERFDAGNKFSSPFAYVPFSAGPRNCIGQKFAMLEMKSTVSKILRKYELLASIPRHDIKLAAEAVLKSANGVHIRLKPRSL